MAAISRGYIHATNWQTWDIRRDIRLGLYTPRNAHNSGGESNVDMVVRNGRSYAAVSETRRVPHVADGPLPHPLFRIRALVLDAWRIF